MTDTAKVLLDLLDLEELDTNLYRGSGSGGETPTRIYGGQVIAQALAAAYATVSGRLCHSLHAYFIRPGDPSRPVIYEVDPARDGRSFTTRRVVAMQNGKQILNLAASFHAPEPGWEHQHGMPDVPPPDGLEPRHEILLRNAFRVEPGKRGEFARPRPFEIREVEPRDPLTPENYTLAWGGLAARLEAAGVPIDWATRETVDIPVVNMTGASFHYVDNGIDSGEVIFDVLDTPIAPDDTILELRWNNFNNSLFPALEQGLWVLARRQPH